MHSSQVAELVKREVDGYRPPPTTSPRGKPLLGRPLSPERIAREIEGLRSALIPPVRAPVVLDSFAAEYWIVARAPDGHVVYFDEARREFGLAQEWPDGRLEDINVRGDVVGVFIAR